MAASDPDPQSLESWNGAFQRPVMETRRLEKQLRVQVSTDKDRLRTLVGTSYRSLLTTAEEIIQMHEKTKAIDGLVGDISQKCNSTSLVAVDKELVGTQHNSKQHSQERRTHAAQLALLDNCSTVISKLLKRHGSLSLAAKLLTISRLLHKTLSQGSTSSDFLETFRFRIAALRRNLLLRIDRRLASGKSTPDQLIDAMSAFCLATSSSSTDVLKHFQSLRLDAIRRHHEYPEGVNKSSPALQVWIQTLRTTKDLLGRRLLLVFKSLRKKPILNDPELTGLEGLNIDLYRQWVAPEVRNFVPWLKSVELSGTEASLLLESWSKSAFLHFLEDLEVTLGSTNDLSQLLATRYDLFHVWLPVWKSTPSHSTSDILDGLRAALNKHLQRQFRRNGQAVVNVLDQLQDIVNTQQKNPSHVKILWAHNFVTSSLDGGASNFTAELIARHSGQPPVLVNALKSLDEWITTMRDGKAVIEGLRKIRWLDIIEEDDDDDTTEASTISKILQAQDPDLYLSAHDSGLADGLSKFQTGLHDLLNQKKETHADLLLRLVRTVCQKLTTAFPQSDLAPLISAIPALHDHLASDVLRTIKTTRIPKPKPLPKQYLWDGGHPPTPVLPSPRIFKFLRLLMDAMASHGEDLWIAPAVDALKSRVWSAVVKDDLFRVRHGSQSSLQNGDVNGAADSHDGLADGDGHGVHANTYAGGGDRDAQNLFDMLFLRAALSTKQMSAHIDEDLKGICDVEAMESGAVERLNGKAAAYWDRTKLLFGMLVP
ncbi:MAG: hypothetical protein Q9160_007643 [Pyrenula sp. 1 TL-2023]